MDNIPPTCGQLLPPHASPLIDGVKDETGQSIYASPNRGGLYRCNEYDGYIVKHRFMAPVPLVDSIFLEKFLERLQSNWKPGYEDWIQKLQQRREGKQGHKQEVRRQIKEAHKQLLH